MLDCKEIFGILQGIVIYACGAVDPRLRGDDVGQTQEQQMQKRQQNSNRGDRIASKVQTLVAEILRDEFSDDVLLSGVSLVGAVSHGGLQFVRLFYYSRSSDVAAVQKRLDDVTKTIRFELASRMNQKYVPEIKFEYDDTLERAARIDDLLNNLKD